jgi:exopolyphosphatase / guanosine-5'-triphosphate,3'-diphosphate pyrophosphatase
VLAGILRVAVGLDRNHGRRVSGLRVAGDDGRLVIGALPEPGQDVSLELYAAGTRSDLLADGLGVPVDVVEVDGAEAPIPA